MGQCACRARLGGLGSDVRQHTQARMRSGRDASFCVSRGRHTRSLCVLECAQVPMCGGPGHRSSTARSPPAAQRKRSDPPHEPAPARRLRLRPSGAAVTVTATRSPGHGPGHGDAGHGSRRRGAQVRDRACVRENECKTQHLLWQWH